MARSRILSPTTYELINQRIYRGVFEGSPNAYLVLTPDLKIINGNDAFVALARLSRDVFAGRYMFDAFPANTEAENTGVSNLMASFNRVLASKRRDTLLTQRYDVQNPRGLWETRHFDGTSWPILDDKTEAIDAVILHVDEIVQSDETTELLAEAQARIAQSRALAEKVCDLTKALRDGRLDALETLRDLLH